MATGMKVTLHKTVEHCYKHYHGDTTVAIVKDGKCVYSRVNGQTGSLFVSNNPDVDPWQGSTEAELLANGFTYRSAQAVFTDEQGHRFTYDHDEKLFYCDSWEEDIPVIKAGDAVVIDHTPKGFKAFDEDE